MLAFKQLSLEDRDIINKYLKVWNSDSSDLSFANLYTWSCSYCTRYAIENDALFIMQMHPNSKMAMCIPLPFDKTANLASYIELIREYCCKNNISIDLGIPSEEHLNKFINDLGDNYEIVPNENNFDYVYSSDSLITLSGNKLHSKRNHINKFLSLYEPEFFIFDDSHKEECLKLYCEWYKEKGEGTKNIDDEICAVEKVLNEYKQLGLTGCVIKVNGRIIAFSFGEKLNENTALIHVEKYIPEYDGIGAYINREFIKNCWADIEFINREEDMGIEGLRRAKKSYMPVKMVKKYTVKNFICEEN